MMPPALFWLDWCAALERQRWGREEKHPGGRRQRQSGTSLTRPTLLYLERIKETLMPSSLPESVTGWGPRKAFQSLRVCSTLLR